MNTLGQALPKWTAKTSLELGWSKASPLLLLSFVISHTANPNLEKPWQKAIKSQPLNVSDQQITAKRQHPIPAQSLKSQHVEDHANAALQLPGAGAPCF